MLPCIIILNFYHCIQQNNLKKICKVYKLYLYIFQIGQNSFLIKPSYIFYILKNKGKLAVFATFHSTKKAFTSIWIYHFIILICFGQKNISQYFCECIEIKITGLRPIIFMCMYSFHCQNVQCFNILVQVPYSLFE